MSAKVYFSRDISPEKVVELYRRLGVELPGKATSSFSSAVLVWPVSDSRCWRKPPPMRTADASGCRGQTPAQRICVPNLWPEKAWPSAALLWSTIFRTA